MDRYFIEVDHARRLQLPSQKEVTYTHDVINTVSVALSIASTLATMYFTYKSKISKIQHNADDAIEMAILDGEILTILSRILDCTNATRVTIALLHGHPSQVIPELQSLNEFKYYSVIWEATETGSAPTKPMYRNTVIVDVADVFAESLEHQDRFVTFTKKNTKNEKLLYRMATIGNGAVLFRLMGDSMDGFFGIFTIQFSEVKFYQGVWKINRNILEKISELFIVVEEKTRQAKQYKLANTKLYLAN